MTEARPAPFFVGDDLALDFLNSVAVPWGRKIEWLVSGDDLVAWLEQAHALPAGMSAQLPARAGSRTLDAVASEARELREWFRTFVGRHAGRPLGRAALRELGLLNQLLGQDQAYRQIEAARLGVDNADDPGGHRALRWRSERRWQSPGALLLPIAEAMGDLVCERDFSLVRKCEAPACTLWFLDVSKGHARRWCSMAVCGNRAKAAAHRARASRRRADRASASRRTWT